MALTNPPKFSIFSSRWGGITTWTRELDLTDAIGQIIVATRYNENVLTPSILAEKTLVRAWCGPGAGLVRPGAGSKTEAAQPASLQDRIAPRPKPHSRPRSKTEAAQPASLQDQSRTAGLAFRS